MMSCPCCQRQRARHCVRVAGGMKTAVSVLQEMMVKLGQTPEYECVSQTGLQHEATFEYVCRALGASVRASARSKKEAKQEAARLLLRALSAGGQDVPPEYAAPRADRVAPPAPAPAPGPHSYVALLKDLCAEYRLPAVEYELVGDTGPAHMRQFTIRASVSSHVRQCTASTKKAARQLAAQQLYAYLRANLARLTKDFDEEDALVRAHERAMERYVEAREDAPWRPALGQRLAHYHATLFAHIDEEKRSLAMAALEAELGDEASAEESPAERALAAAAGALGLTLAAHVLPAADGALHVLELTPTLPEVALAGQSREEAAQHALRFLRLALAAAAAHCAAQQDADEPAPSIKPVNGKQLTGPIA